MPFALSVAERLDNRGRQFGRQFYVSQHHCVSRCSGFGLRRRRATHHRAAAFTRSDRTIVRHECIDPLRVTLVHMIGFEDMAQVHSVRVAPTHMVVAGMVATVPVRR